MPGIIYKGKNYSAMNTSAVATKENQENQALTLESLQAQITALQEAVAKIPTTGGSQKTLKFNESGTINANSSKTFTSSNGGELRILCYNGCSFVIDGVSGSSAFINAEQKYANDGYAYGVSIPFKNSITINVTNESSASYSLYKYE